ncbi:MAG: MBL fold metallo-hydrolase [Spirochaetes bacterium]|nr:MBL fold metallo-hydrolase [Spirochaetota bacterium]
MNKSRWYKSGGELLNEIEAANAENEMLLWFLGQMGFVLKTGNTVIYIDALLNDFSNEKTGTRRLYDPPYTTLQGIRADYFLSTHNHGDHLSLETILPQAAANHQTRFIVPAPWRGVLTGAGVDETRVIGACEGQTLELPGGVSILPVAAAHPEYKTSAGDYICLGYLIRGTAGSLYHAGDTYVTERLVTTLEGLKPIDVAILPVNGGDWERASIGIIGNMNAGDALKLAQRLEVDLVIPAHYDMMNNNNVNPAHFADEAYRSFPWQKYHIFALGEKFVYQK